MAPNTWDNTPSELAGQGYNDDDIFTSRSITVPEFAYGKPFYNISLNDYAYLSNAVSNQTKAYNWLINGYASANDVATAINNEGIRYYNNGDNISMDSGPSWGGIGWSLFRSFCEPDVIISGTTLTYRYLAGWRDNILGDYNGIFIGAHKITYGVV
ncbi:hypothetical protein DDT56_23495 [Brenneria corticis]|uniref:Uncharacterized protein n=2 Tax=Brenneria corticis TaxID=2173106 RepID=A0A2U1TJQ0_9GAMM|nr:hypothetical protein DDT56_23495 [Brenneria sp. CFCC 11842]